MYLCCVQATSSRKRGNERVKPPSLMIRCSLLTTGFMRHWMCCKRCTNPTEFGSAGTGMIRHICSPEHCRIGRRSVLPTVLRSKCTSINNIHLEPGCIWFIVCLAVYVWSWIYFKSRQWEGGKRAEQSVLITQQAKQDDCGIFCPSNLSYFEKL